MSVPLCCCCYRVTQGVEGSLDGASRWSVVVAKRLLRRGAMLVLVVAGVVRFVEEEDDESSLIMSLRMQDKLYSS